MTMESRKKKVLEIAKQAGFVVDIGGHDDRNANLYYDLDRFAELIVKECIDITSGLSKLFPRTDVSFDVGYTMGTTRATKEIKQHFGVEE